MKFKNKEYMDSLKKAYSGLEEHLENMDEIKCKRLMKKQEMVDKIINYTLLGGATIGIICGGYYILANYYFK